MRHRLTDAIAISRLLQAAALCVACGKPFLVLSVNPTAGRRAIPETVSPETHCACDGGPAAPRQVKTDANFMYGDPIKMSRVSKGSRPIQ